jgi:alkaline phosphatase
MSMAPGTPVPTRLAIGFALFALACAPADVQTQVDTPERPSAVIFLISDGAAAAHWTLALFADDDLALKRMKTIGLVDTRGADHIVSGSAPTASAYATGVRTFMGAISVDMDSVPVPSVLEAAQDRGWATGLVTTTAIEDATPAAFGTHVASRTQLGEIARQMFDKRVDVIMGGGRRFFRPEEQAGGRDLLTEGRSSYPYVSSVAELRDLDTDTVDSLLGLLAEGEMGIVAERGADALTLMGTSAIEILDHDPDGFFLMVENEESDSRSHANDTEEVIRQEMLDFDRLVRVALDYQAEHPGTLVLVTGDHETGGLTLPYRSDHERTPYVAWTTGGHTGTLLPIFASGPGAERFGGIIRNDEVGRILKELVRGR